MVSESIWLSIIVTMRKEDCAVPNQDSSDSFKFADIVVVSESIWLSIVVTMRRDDWTVPR